MTITILLAAVIISSLSGQTPAQALTNLKDSPYGFQFCDVGITADDMSSFAQLDVQAPGDYNQCGQFETLTENISTFLHAMGESSPELVQEVAARIAGITHALMALSGQETGWFSLRAATPTDAYDIPRWHMDGYYFSPTQPTAMMYKCAVTLVGEPTMFYPVEKDVRKSVWRKTVDRNAMHTFCAAENIIRPPLGHAVLFMGGQTTLAALHSEPPIHTPRLFFSVVPCSEKQREELSKKVRPTVWPVRKEAHVAAFS